MNECMLCICSDDGTRKKEEKESSKRQAGTRTYTHIHTHTHTHTHARAQVEKSTLGTLGYVSAHEQITYTRSRSAASHCVSLRLTDDWPTGLSCLANQLVDTRATLAQHTYTDIHLLPRFAASSSNLHLTAFDLRLYTPPPSLPFPSFPSVRAQFLSFSLSFFFRRQSSASSPSASQSVGLCSAQFSSGGVNWSKPNIYMCIVTESPVRVRVPLSQPAKNSTDRLIERTTDGCFRNLSEFDGTDGTAASVATRRMVRALQLYVT